MYLLYDNFIHIIHTYVIILIDKLNFILILNVFHSKSQCFVF
jgi:hypothetical protein